MARNYVEEQLLDSRRRAWLTACRPFNIKQYGAGACDHGCGGRPSMHPSSFQGPRAARVSYAQRTSCLSGMNRTALEEMYPQIPLCLHQDHGNEEVDVRHRDQARLSPPS